MEREAKNARAKNRCATFGCQSQKLPDSKYCFTCRVVIESRGPKT